MSYGYRYGEVPLPKIGPWKDSLLLTRPLNEDSTIRPSIGESLGCHFKGALLPGPCFHDTKTMVAGVLKRSATKTPIPNPSLFQELLDFAKRYVKKIFHPLPASSDVSVEAWLVKCPNYSQVRKAELLDKYYKITNRMAFKNRFVKSFCKDERYPEYKHARAINSRVDEFKTLVGPYFRLIEEVFYKHPDFIKKIPVADRPSALFAKLCKLGVPVQCMDFKAMESHFTEITFELEFQFYEFMTQFLSGASRFMNEVREVIGGLNTCFFKNFVSQMMCARMSGEMNTSLGNAYVNWIISKFVAFKHGVLDSHEGYFEGDDSAVISPYIPSPKDYEDLGFKIEMSTEPSVDTASFCGMIFDPVEKTNITDPLQELITFGWTNRRYVGAKLTTKLALLRCKSLSMVYQYQGCPILAALGRYGLRCSRRICVDKVKQSMSLWEREQFEQAQEATRGQKLKLVLSRPIGMRTRLLMEKHYGITVDDQIKVERILDSMNDICPMDFPFLMKYMHKDWTHYYDNYVIEFPASDFDRRFYRQPPSTWSRTGTQEWPEDIFVEHKTIMRKATTLSSKGLR